MQGEDECQKVRHMLGSCSHPTDWNNYQVNIQLIHLFSWQADNPYINPAWLFKEINMVMTTRLEECMEKIQGITNELTSLTENNELVNRCNKGLFFQMQQDHDKYEKQLNDISKHVKTLESKISN